MKPYLISVKEIRVSWDPTLHMAIHERIQEATQDGTDLKGWYCLTSTLCLTIIHKLYHNSTNSCIFTANNYHSGYLTKQSGHPQPLSVLNRNPFPSSILLYSNLLLAISNSHFLRHCFVFLIWDRPVYCTPIPDSCVWHDLESS